MVKIFLFQFLYIFALSLLIIIFVYTRLMNIKKSQGWTPSEDQMLIELYEKVDCFQRWKFISKKFLELGIQKTEFQCRERFTNHVDPSIRQGKLSKSEIAKLFKCYDEYGPHWSNFQMKIPGRPQSSLKNKFYSTLRTLIRHFMKVSQKRNLNIGNLQSQKISTKLLTELYQGKRKFIACKNILKNTLKNINYNFECQQLQYYLNLIPYQQLQSLFKTINQDIEAKKTKSYRSIKKNKINHTNKNYQAKSTNSVPCKEQNQSNIHQGQQNNNVYADLPQQQVKIPEEAYPRFFIFPLQPAWNAYGTLNPSMMNYTHE